MLTHHCPQLCPTSAHDCPMPYAHLHLWPLILVASARLLSKTRFNNGACHRPSTPTVPNCAGFPLPTGHGYACPLSHRYSAHPSWVCVCERKMEVMSSKWSERTQLIFGVNWFDIPILYRWLLHSIYRPQNQTLKAIGCGMAPSFLISPTKHILRLSTISVNTLGASSNSSVWDILIICASFVNAVIRLQLSMSVL
jgi:hypothetical protein